VAFVEQFTSSWTPRFLIWVLLDLKHSAFHVLKELICRVFAETKDLAGKVLRRWKSLVESSQPAPEKGNRPADTCVNALHRRVQNGLMAWVHGGPDCPPLENGSTDEGNKGVARLSLAAAALRRTAHRCRAPSTI
jgi:hypothetical protein